jgi:hypothetical protein
MNLLDDDLTHTHTRSSGLGARWNRMDDDPANLGVQDSGVERWSRLRFVPVESRNQVVGVHKAGHRRAGIIPQSFNRSIIQ